MINTIPSSSWLFPEEHRVVVSRLLDWELIKFDVARELPLKNGGTTDIYINLRDARNHPEALKYIAELFSTPILRIDGIKRFVEVPDSVSCFAGLLSERTGIPYLTICESVKEGRAFDARVIGTSVKGHDICIIDDVITNGDSKIVPVQVCSKLGLNTRAIIVLVDRQQGWSKHLEIAGALFPPVWAGMTLHDVRRELITGLGVMERCNGGVEDSNPIILALDGLDWDDILPIIDQLRATGCILKVNDLLLDQGIANLVPQLTVYGRVMADLKCHDIPDTVARSCKHLRAYEPWAVTVHASGGPNMVKAAVNALEGTSTKVLAVTVLTSIDPKTCEEIYARKPLDEVLVLAELACSAGCDGFVCSPMEVKELRNCFPKMTLVTPGVRSVGVEQHDQTRISTPVAAIENGADHVVIGRQVLKAEDPVGEVRRLLNEELVRR